MTRPTLFAISGFKRSGKDTVAFLLQKKLSKHSVKYAFADPVREAAKAFFGWTDDYFSDDRKEKIDHYWGISPRQALQYIGTEVGRQGFRSEFIGFDLTTGDKIWIRRFEKFVKELWVDYKDNAIIVSDMRFPNELESVMSFDESGTHKVITIAVDRPGLSTDGHASENHIQDVMDRCQYTLHNDKTISKLDMMVENILFEHDLLKLEEA